VSPTLSGILPIVAVFCDVEVSPSLQSLLLFFLNSGCEFFFSGLSMLNVSRDNGIELEIPFIFISLTLVLHLAFLSSLFSSFELCSRCYMKILYIEIRLEHAQPT